MSAQPSRGLRRRRPAHEASGRARTFQRMIVGERLRQLRVAAGCKEIDAAKAIGYGYSSKISRMESGEHDFKDSEVRGLLDFYGVTDPEVRKDVLGLAMKANQPGWWDQWSDISTKALQTHVSLEGRAQRIRSFETAQLLGLLQIPDYTRALVQANTNDAHPSTVERMVEFRATRQRQFLESSDAELMCVLDEVTLTRGYGSKTTMRQQLDHLIALADHPRITFRLVPLNKMNAPVQVGTATIFDFAEDELPGIVYLERANGGNFILNADLVDEHVKGFDRLLSASLNPVAALQRMRDYRKKA